MENNNNNNNNNNNKVPFNDNAIDTILDEIKNQHNYKDDNKNIDNNTNSADTKSEKEISNVSNKQEFKDISSSSNEKVESNASMFASNNKLNSNTPVNIPIEENVEEKKKGVIKYVIGGGLVAVILVASAFMLNVFFNNDVIPTATPLEDFKKVEKPVKETVFAKGVHVSGIDISGKTLQEAETLLILKQKETAPDIDVIVSGETKAVNFTENDFTYYYDTAETVKLAYSYSKSVEDSIANNDPSLVKLPDSPKVETNSDKTNINFIVNCTVTADSINKAVKTSDKKLSVKAIEPHVSKFDTTKKGMKMFTFKEGSEGTAINTTKLKEDLENLFVNGAVSGTIATEQTVTKPKLKMEDVKKATFLVGNFSTITTNVYNSNYNMEVALKATNGTIVESGKEFSFNKCTGDSNLTSNGYVGSTVIENGSYEIGVGGGICQSATTIYNAGIEANMGIVERAPHLWCSTYVYGGLDATINYSKYPEANIDLRLRNNTDYQMFFKTWMDGTKLNCEIYGYMSPEFDEVRTKSWTSWSNSEAYGIEAERVYYKNGKKVGTEDLPSSTYSLSKGHYIVAGDPGTTSTKIKQPAGLGNTKPEDETKPKPTQPKPKPTTAPTTAPKPKPTIAPTTAKPTEPPTEPTTAKPTEPTTAKPTEPPTTAPTDPPLTEPQVTVPTDAVVG